MTGVTQGGMCLYDVSLDLSLCILVSMSMKGVCVCVCVLGVSVSQCVWMCGCSFDEHGLPVRSPVSVGM